MKKMEAAPAFPLGLLAQGETAEIVFSGVGRHAACGGCRPEELGLRPGRTIEVLANGGGPLLVRVDESRIAIGRRAAMQVAVRRLP